MFFPEDREQKHTLNFIAANQRGMITSANLGPLFRRFFFETFRAHALIRQSCLKGGGYPVTMSSMALYPSVPLATVSTGLYEQAMLQSAVKKRISIFQYMQKT
jgi:hypothetical protein